LRHFKESEFDCPCCGQNMMEPAFKNMLDAARTLAGIPFVINSGYRCAKHNADVDVGGSPTSSHLIGVAADIECHLSSERYTVLYALLDAGVKRIGIGDGFIHADLDLMKPQKLIWEY
jgi:zinc D-Ala-D-Ala carboxypeptidase